MFSADTWMLFFLSNSNVCFNELSHYLSIHVKTPLQLSIKVKLELIRILKHIWSNGSMFQMRTMLLRDKIIYSRLCSFFCGRTKTENKHWISLFSLTLVMPLATYYWIFTPTWKMKGRVRASPTECLDLYHTDSIFEWNTLGFAFKFSLEKVQSTKHGWKRGKQNK